MQRDRACAALSFMLSGQNTDEDAMITLVDMEHASAIGDATDRDQHSRIIADLRRRLEVISGQPCVVRRYPDVTRAWLLESGTRALILSGNRTEWLLYDPRDLRDLQEAVRDPLVPVLGLCGGLQFIVLAYGGHVAPIRELGSDESDIPGSFGTGYLKEWGFKPVRLLAPDPLFRGMEVPVFLQAHYWEVKEVPDGFSVLASSDLCRIQALRRVDALVYGTQFHPEGYTIDSGEHQSALVEFVYPDGYSEPQPDGRTLLINFFAAAGILTGSRTASSSL